MNKINATESVLLCNFTIREVNQQEFFSDVSLKNELHV